MQLVIAEKPSVAKSIAEVLGATDRKDGYFEGSGYLVSWCIGHLIELAQPESYGEQWKKWTLKSSADGTGKYGPKTTCMSWVTLLTKTARRSQTM